MMCPQCHGHGRVRQRRLDLGGFYWLELPCPYDGCINGIVHCCDGLQNNERETDDNNM
jgi:DnaJ-class molecular chaperone